MKQLILSLLLATFVFCMHSCSDDETPIDADDNFVTSVVFTVEGETYDAVIDKDVITIKVPYTISLNNVTVDFKFTPSAVIYPDPTTIKDWDNERFFRVVSYNGDEKKYTYRVIKDDIREEGDVTLADSIDIKTFAEKGVTIIKGNLTIGTDDGQNIKDIKALEKLKQIEGNIIIKNSYKGTDLTGFDNLTSIGGLQIGTEEAFSTSPIYQVSFRSLTTITGNLILHNDSTQWVMGESLTTIGGNAIINSSTLQSIKMDKLSGIEGNFDIQSATKDSKGNPQMEGIMVSISFPKLVSVKDTFSVNYLASLREIKLEKLQNAGAILFKTLPIKFETLEMPAIKSVEGDLYINSQTVNIAIGSITKRNETLTSFGGFDKLEKVGGTLTFSNFSKVTNLPNVSNVSLGGYSLDYMENLNSEFNFSNTTFVKNGDKDCEINIAHTPVSKIIGQKKMNCNINLHYLDITKGTTVFENIDEVNKIDIIISKDRATTNTVDFKIDIKKVINNLYISFNNTKRIPVFSFPNIEEVGANFCIYGSCEYFPSFSAPKLKKIGGQFVIPDQFLLKHIDLSSLETIGCSSIIDDTSSELEIMKNHLTFDIFVCDGVNVVFPMLKKVGGKGMQVLLYSAKPSALQSFSCPKLTTIEGKLAIKGAWGMTEKYLKTFNFPVLQKVGNVDIEYFGALTDFSTFAPLFKNKGIDKGNWTILDCGYNPSYQDMVDGKYTKK